MSGVGPFFYTDWNILTSKTNDIHILAAADVAGGITIVFVVDGSVQANATLAGAGLVGAIGINGAFDWNK